jgi:hypothetical protein
MKAGSVKPPDECLGAQIQKYDLEGREVWSMSSDLYVRRAVADVETELAYLQQGLRAKALPVLCWLLGRRVSTDGRIGV